MRIYNLGDPPAPPRALTRATPETISSVRPGSRRSMARSVNCDLLRVRGLAEKSAKRAGEEPRGLAKKTVVPLGSAWKLEKAKAETLPVAASADRAFLYRRADCDVALRFFTALRK